MNDIWELGDVYERFMGRWSRLIAREFLRWLWAEENGRWLDVGCGTGALSELIVRVAEPKQVTSIDFAAGFISYAQQLHPEAIYDFRVGSALDLPVNANDYDWVVSALALNFFPDPQTAVAQMYRAAKPGGTVALYVWDYAGEMQMLRYFWDAATALDPQAMALDEGKRFPICQPKPLAQLFDNAGLVRIEVQPLVITAVFRDFDDYWQPFLGKNGPAPSYVASLTAEQQTALATQLQQQLPIQSDGTIPLQLRAWAVRGVKS